jgi:hypothetical protein
MPYIHQHEKDEIDALLDELLEFLAINTKDISKASGSLNYIITKILLDTEPQKYSEYNTLVGVLECCKLEFYRRAVVAYEDAKIKENGDVYDNR